MGPASAVVEAHKRKMCIRDRLKRMLLEESLYYVLISGGISLILGTALSRVLLLALNNVIMFFSYRPNFLAFAIMFPLFFILDVYKRQV